MLHFEDLQIGDHWLSLPRRLVREDVIDFAELTGDHDDLHSETSKKLDSPFGRPVVHGLLGLSIMAGLSSKCPDVHTLALVRVGQWQFTKPIYFDDTVHVVTEVVDLATHGRRAGKVIWYRRLINQNNQTVQCGELETLVARKTRTGRAKPLGQPSLALARETSS